MVQHYFKLNIFFYCDFAIPPCVGNIEYWEAVEPTLFPHSLFPLTRFVVMSLSPPRHKRPGPPLHPQGPGGPFQQATPLSSQENYDSSSIGISELARQVVWDCMVEDPRLFFRTLLNQFNRLAADPKCKSSHLDQLLVSAHKLCMYIDIFSCKFHAIITSGSLQLHHHFNTNKFLLLCAIQYVVFWHSLSVHHSILLYLSVHCTYFADSCLANTE